MSVPAASKKMALRIAISPLRTIVLCKEKCGLPVLAFEKRAEGRESVQRRANEHECHRITAARSEVGSIVRRRNRQRRQPWLWSCRGADRRAHPIAGGLAWRRPLF